MTIIYLTHYLDEIEEIQGRVVILDKAKKILDSDYKTIKTSISDLKDITVDSNHNTTIFKDLKEIESKCKTFIFYGFKEFNVVQENSKEIKICCPEHSIPELKQIIAEHTFKINKMNFFNFYMMMIKKNCVNDNEYSCDFISLINNDTLNVPITTKIWKLILHIIDLSTNLKFFYKLVLKNFIVGFSTIRVLNLIILNLSLPVVNYLTFNKGFDFGKIIFHVNIKIILMDFKF